MTHETQETISQWIRATFPGGDDLAPRHCLRLLEEVAELCLAAGATPATCLNTFSAVKPMREQGLGESRPEPPEKVARELADCQIALWAAAARRGVDLQAETDAKMRVNRSRQWRSLADGTGYHLKDGVDTC